jgi:predicted nuclease of restriction endonuclease-like (RecB) superfamily
MKVTDPAARLYYLKGSARFGWSRAVLLNQVKGQAYERTRTEGKSHNFPAALPEHLAEQAEEALKSSYNLEFLGLGHAVLERELEARLIERLRDFILELGYGFCWIGQQHRLTLGTKEYFVDLLFYHRFLRSLVAVELKVGPFEPEYAGKMDFYLNLLNEKERGPGDEPSNHPLRGEGQPRGRVLAQDEGQSNRCRRIPAAVAVAAGAARKAAHP